MDEVKSKTEVGIVAKEAKGAAPRRHHYVPQFYLRGFVGEKDQLFVVDRPSEKTFRTQPKNVATERDFNRVNVEGMDPAAVEKALSEFEGKVAPALERVKAAKSLANKEDRDMVMNLICALAIRNPRQRTTVNGFISEIVQQVAHVGLATKERWKTQVERMKKDGVWDDSVNLTYNDMQKFMREGNYKIQIAKEFNIAMEIEQHENLVQHLGARNWQILVAKEGSGGFVTSDVPVCLRWSDGQNHGIYAPGFGVEGTHVIFPLSTRCALLGSFEGKENVIEADMFMVGNLNSTVISNAEKQVYAHNYSFNYMRPFPQEIGSGATLVQDEQFLAAGKELQDDKVLPLRGK
jgi:hypothetical protein